MIVSLLPSRVTVTGTTVLPSAVVSTLPITTVSLSFNGAPSTVKFSFTVFWSAGVNAVPAVGVPVISTGFVESFTPTVNAFSFLTTGTSTVSLLPSPYVTSTLTTGFPSLLAPPFNVWFVPGTTLPPSTSSFPVTVVPSGTVTACLIFSTSSGFVTFEFSAGTSLNSAVPAVGVTFDATDWTTSISISFETFSCVTFTGTTVLPPFSCIGL